MIELTDEEKSIGAKVLHEAFVEAEFNENPKKADVLKSLRDKLEE